MCIRDRLEINETNDRIQLAFACDPGDGEWVGYDELYLADRKNGEISFAAGAVSYTHLAIGY